MTLDFMKPEVWDGLVIGVTMVGIALAILRLMNDHSRYQRAQQRSNALNEQKLIDLDNED